MELKIERFNVPAVIGFNFEELKSEVSAKAAVYSTMVYSAEQIKEAKADRAALNKFVQALESERKRVKGEWMKPCTDFESRMKEITGIVNAAIATIDDQLNGYEAERRQKKTDQIAAYFSTLSAPEWLKLSMIFRKQWVNATYSMEKVKADIEAELQRITADTEAIALLPEFAFEAMEIYKGSLSLTLALDEAKRLKEMQQRKAAAEAAKATAVTKPAPQPTDRPAQAFQSERTWLCFKAHLTVDDAKALRAFFESRHIEFTALEV